MPVILAALEAICTDDFNCHGVRRLMSAVPVMIINGPIREQIGLRSGRNALGGVVENRANLTIGRAVRLLVQNVGGAKPGFSEMVTMGSAMKMLATTFGEWRSTRGWLPPRGACGNRKPPHGADPGPTRDRESMIGNPLTMRLSIPQGFQS